MAATEEKKYLINVESNLDEYTKYVQESTKAVDEWKKKQKEAEEQHGKNSKEYVEATAQLKVAQKEQRQATATLEKMTAAQKANGTSYNDLYRIWVASEAKLKSLEGTLKRNADGTFKLTEEYKKAKIESSNAKKALDEFGKGINNNKLNVGNYTESVKEALKQTGLFGRLNISGGMIALGAAVAGVWSQFKSAIQYTKEFEKSLSSLRALTGASSDDLKFYRQAAKDLGNQFGTTGAEMVEAFKIVGSAKSELLKSKEELVNVTEAAVLLSKAAGMDVPSAANSLTIAMNQFSAPAEEAGRYINVLAAGAKEGAAEIPDLSDSLTKFGAVAASSNVSIEQSVALIEALSEKGIKGDVAGTGIKSFLLKLESGARETRPSVVGLDKALENLKNQNLSNAEVTKRFGLETANVALTLINQTKRVKELTSAVEGTNEAYKQAAINQDNISGATDRLSSKWTNFKETLLNGKGAFSNFFKGLLNDITDVISGLESLLKSSQELRLEAIDRENKRVLTSYQELIKVAHDRLTIEADIAQFTSNRAQWESKLITAKKQGDEEEIQKAEKKVRLYDSLLKIAIKQKEVNEKPAKSEVKNSVSDEKEKAKNASDVWQKYYNDRRALLEAERILAEGNYEKLKKNIIDFYELDVQKSELTANQKYLLEVQKNKAIRDLELKRIDEIQKAEKEYANFLEQLNAEALS